MNINLFLEKHELWKITNTINEFYLVNDEKN